MAPLNTQIQADSVVEVGSGTSVEEEGVTPGFTPSERATGIIPGGYTVNSQPGTWVNVTGGIAWQPANQAYFTGAGISAGSTTTLWTQ